MRPRFTAAFTLAAGACVCACAENRPEPNETRNVASEPVAPAESAPPVVEGPKKYDVDWVGHWKLGQIATVTEHETKDMDMTMDGKPFKSAHETFDARYVVRCDALDSAGAPSKKTIFVESWKNGSDAESDQSISGLRVVIDGKTWTLPAGATAGPLAKKWLDRQCTRGAGDPFSKLAPPKMTVGDTWKPDQAAVSKAFSAFTGDAPFEFSNVDMEIKLASVDGASPVESGTFDMTVHCPIAAKPSAAMPSGMVLLPGASAEAVGTVTCPLTTSTILGAYHFAVTMTMDLEMSPQGRKMLVAAKGRVVQDKQTVDGGEIPEPVTPDAPKNAGR
jgi:hypothetical protein